MQLNLKNTTAKLLLFVLVLIFFNSCNEDKKDKKQGVINCDFQQLVGDYFGEKNGIKFYLKIDQITKTNTVYGSTYGREKNSEFIGKMISEKEKVIRIELNELGDEKWVGKYSLDFKIDKEMITATGTWKGIHVSNKYYIFLNKKNKKMKKKISKNDIIISNVSKRNPLKMGLYAAGLMTVMSLSSCYDEKSCTDADRAADGNGSTVYDTGTYQDTGTYADYGGDTDRGYGDSIGNGDLCSDYD